MTSLTAWVAVDGRGTSALYFASDSRLTWSPKGLEWSFGRKLFASRSTSDIFGYCGDVLFPSLVLGQVESLLNSSFLFAGGGPPEDRHKGFVRMIQSSFESYPIGRRAAFSIIHGAREGASLKSAFHLWRLDWSEQAGWKDTKVNLPNESRMALALGSGAGAFIEWEKRWQRPLGRVSRAVFGAFCDALKSGDDPKTGGAPRLVRLYRDGPGSVVGVIWDGERFILGISVPEENGTSAAEWRNAQFERCDPKTMAIPEGAQPQPRPW
jgi:hypothetical protein